MCYRLKFDRVPRANTRVPYINGKPLPKSTQVNFVTSLALFLLLPSNLIAQDVPVIATTGKQEAFCGHPYTEGKCVRITDDKTFVQNRSIFDAPSNLAEGQIVNFLKIDKYFARSIRNYKKRMKYIKTRRSIVLSFDLTKHKYDRFYVTRDSGNDKTNDCTYKFNNPPPPGRAFWHGRLDCANPQDRVIYTLRLQNGKESSEYKFVFAIK